MENPLTEELIDELNEIIKLPKEEQSLELKEYFKKLTPEQIEFLKQSQTQQCVFCGIALGSIESHKIYEDGDLVCVLDINPASKGHVLVIPKMHLKYSFELNNKIFEVTNLVCKKIKDTLNLDTNIIVSNGIDAGEKFEHLVINIIPRKKDDGINFAWKFNKVNEKELEELNKKLKIELPKKEIKKEDIVERVLSKKIRIP